MRSSTSVGVWVGLMCGREDRSANPASPSSWKRAIHVRTHLRETPIAAAMCAFFQPFCHRSTISSRP